jgi:hypothetical protein
LQLPIAIDVVVEFNSLWRIVKMVAWRVRMGLENSEVLEMLARAQLNADLGTSYSMQEATDEVLSVDSAWASGRNAYIERGRLSTQKLGRVGLEASLLGLLSTSEPGFLRVGREETYQDAGLRSFRRCVAGDRGIGSSELVLWRGAGSRRRRRAPEWLPVIVVERPGHGETG